jgi:uncharacterized protein YkwD
MFQRRLFPGKRPERLLVLGALALVLIWAGHSRTSPYPRNDAWKGSLAGEDACPGGESADKPSGEQRQTMLCLVNYARAEQGVQPLAASPVLNRSAAAKANAMFYCDRFAHSPCGGRASQEALDAGYEGPFGENAYLAVHSLAAPRVALDHWLNSPGHRENLFDPHWRTIGIARRDHSDVEHVIDGVVWITQFDE